MVSPFDARSTAAWIPPSPLNWHAGVRPSSGQTISVAALANDAAEHASSVAIVRRTPTMYVMPAPGELRARADQASRPALAADAGARWTPYRPKQSRRAGPRIQPAGAA